MQGPASRLIRSQGRTYTIQNATGGDGRSVPDYSDDGTLVGVLEQRRMPRVATDSAGEDVETDLELRTVNETTAIQPAGTADEYPSLLVDPNGREYRVINTFSEDGGVTVLTLLRD